MIERKMRCSKQSSSPRVPSPLSFASPSSQQWSGLDDNSSKSGIESEIWNSFGFPYLETAHLFTLNFLSHIVTSVQFGRFYPMNPTQDEASLALYHPSVFKFEDLHKGFERTAPFRKAMSSHITFLWKKTIRVGHQWTSIMVGVVGISSSCPVVYCC